MEIEFTPDERIVLANKALDELCEEYGVELCANTKTEFWFELKAPKKPELKVV